MHPSDCDCGCKTARPRCVVVGLHPPPNLAGRMGGIRKEEPLNTETGAVYTVPEGEKPPANTEQITADEAAMVNLIPAGTGRRWEALQIYRHLTGANKANMVETLKALPEANRGQFIHDAYHCTPKLAPYEEPPLPNQTAPKAARLAKKKHRQKLAKARRKRGR